MKRQLVYIGWGVPKENFDSYYACLEAREYNPYYERQMNWADTLDIYIWNQWDYWRIPLPEKGFADYSAWKIMFEKIIPFLEKDVSLIGVSLGGTFLLKYLTENPQDISINKIFLVAAALSDSPQEKLWSFQCDKEKIPTIAEKVWQIYCYHSRDDDIVDFADFELLQKLLPQASFRSFSDRGHFYSLERFPEIEVDLQRA